MANDILFNQKLIQEEEQNYSKVDFHPSQRAMVEPIAKVFIQYVRVSELAMRGFLMRATVKWQEKHHKSLKEMHEVPKDEKIKTMNEIFNTHLIEIMTKIVIKPEQVGMLKKAINEAAELVLSKYF